MWVKSFRLENHFKVYRFTVGKAFGIMSFSTAWRGQLQETIVLSIYRVTVSPS